MLLTHGEQQRDIFLCDYMPFFKFRALVLARYYLSDIMSKYCSYGLFYGDFFHLIILPSFRVIFLSAKSSVSRWL